MVHQVIKRLTSRGCRYDAKLFLGRYDDVSTFDNLMDHYKLDTGHYPSQDAGLQSLVTNVENDPKWGGPYIKGSLHNDPWGHPYMYSIPSQHGMDYDIYSAGPDGQAATAIGNWNDSGSVLQTSVSVVRTRLQGADYGTRAAAVPTLTDGPMQLPVRSVGRKATSPRETRNTQPVTRNTQHATRNSVSAP